MRSSFSILILSVSFFSSSALFAQPGTTPPAAGTNNGSRGAADLLRGTGLVIVTDPDHGPATLTASALKAMPHVTVTICNSHTNADETYSGVRLSYLLARLGAPLGDELRGKALANYIVAKGSDGYKAVLALGEVDPSFHPGEVLVADTMDGEPLDAHSGPFKLVVTEDKRPARSVRNLVSIELKEAP
jgi:hypothetical protein